MKPLGELVSQVDLDRWSLSRRHLLQVMGVGTVSALLVACGSDDDDEETPDTGSGTEAEPTSPADETSESDAEPTEASSDDAPDSGDGDGSEGSLEAYAAIVGPPPEDPLNPNVGTPRFGGDLNIASYMEPPHFDPHLASLGVIQGPGMDVAETLFTFDLESNSAPMLADSWELNADATELTVQLRQGVLFHNGEEMLAEDVQASFERWLGGEFGSGVADLIESIETPDDYTVVFQLTRSYPFIVTQFTAPNGANVFIFPKELMESAGSDAIEPIGTGPYQFVEWQENRYLHLTQFKDYVGREESPDGWGGGKVPYLDNIYIHFIPDEAVRVAGMETGEYQLAEAISIDQYDRFADDPNIRTRIQEGNWPCSKFNLQSGPMSDLRIRQAFKAAVDVTQVTAALGPADFFETSPSLMWLYSVWASNAGEEVYLEYDPDKARALLEEAGYDGEPIRWLGDPSNPLLWTPGVVAEPMLTEVGFNIELVALDGAALNTNRNDPDLMDIFNIDYAMRDDPTFLTPLQSGTAGWWDTDTKNELMEQIRQEQDQATRIELWSQLQELWWTELPGMKWCTAYRLFLESETYSGARNPGAALTYRVNSWFNE